MRWMPACWISGSTAAAIAAGCAGEAPPSVEVEPVVADTFAVTSRGRVLSFERESGAIASALPIIGLAEDDAILGIDHRPADLELYALTRRGKLYALDPSKGTLLVRSSLEADAADASAPFDALSGEFFALSFDPVRDELRVLSDAGQSLRVDAPSGATLSDELPDGSARWVAASHTSGFAAACRARMFAIDAPTSSLWVESATGGFVEIAAVSAPRDERRPLGIEIVTDSEGRVAALAYWPSEGGTLIYDLDLQTGALSGGRLLELAPGEIVLGLSAAPPLEGPPQATGELLGVSEDARLVSFNRAAPNKLCSDVAIEGLPPGEVVFGMDRRPADGRLYALGSSGRLYTLDAGSAQAELHATLRADRSDATQPFVGLPANERYGFGFEPSSDRLRVVSRRGANLRIDPDTGATTSDASLSPTSMAVPAVAYTNAFASAPDTTLYAIDAAGAVLARIGGDPATDGPCPGDLGNPDCGNVVMVGSLGLDDMTDVGGFAIDPEPSARTGLLVLSVGAAAGSSLYEVDLDTGRVAPPARAKDPSVAGATLIGLTFASVAGQAAR